MPRREQAGAASTRAHQILADHWLIHAEHVQGEIMNNLSENMQERRVEKDGDGDKDRDGESSRETFCSIARVSGSMRFVLFMLLERSADYSEPTGVDPGIMAGFDALRFRGLYVNVAAWETPVSYDRAGAKMHSKCLLDSSRSHLASSWSKRSR